MIHSKTGVLSLLVIVSACGQKGVVPGVANDNLFTNGNFDGDPIGNGTVPPSGWTTERFLNNNVTPLAGGAPTMNLGLLAVPPLSEADLNLTPSAGTLRTFTFGNATPETQSDAELGAAGTTLRYPKFGINSVVVNSGIFPGAQAGAQNANALRQMMTITAADIDPNDGRIHFRFVAAPVLQDPGHPSFEQPYFFVQLKNVTRSNQILYTNFNFAGQGGVPWKTVGAIKYTDWQVIDISPGAPTTIGDTVELVVYASGCSRGGHWGRVYVDAFGAIIPGLFVIGTAPATKVHNTNIQYDLRYTNGSSGSGSLVFNDTSVVFNTPPNTTFVSAPANCTGLAPGATGALTCDTGDLAAGDTGTLAIVVHINSGTSGLLTAGNYSITAIGSTPLYGNKIDTQVTGPPASISVVSGSPGSAAVHNAFPQLVAVVRDASANPVVGATVAWAAPGSAATSTLSGTTTTTGATGEVVATATANGVASATAYNVTATAAGVGTPASFALTNTVGPVSSVTIAPASQSATVNMAFATQLVATVTDADGNPISGQSLTFTAPAQTGASATFAPAGPYVTNASGQVTVTATANAHAGVYLATATVGATSGTASLTNTAGAVTTVAVAPPAQTTAENTAFATPVVVTVTDADGNGVPGQTVSFTAPAQTGPSATFAPAGPYVTDAAGQVTVTATANGHVGAGYTVTAAVGAASGIFTLTNTLGAVSSVTVAPPSQSTVVTTAFATPVVVTVTDSGSNPLPGQTVTFTAPAQTGPSATFAPAGPYVTNASGQVTVTAMANTHAGALYTVTAAVGAISGTFSLTNTVGAVSSVTAAPASQSTAVTTSFAAPVIVTVTDSSGNPIVGQTVTFAAPAQTGPSATFAPVGPYTTDAAGHVTVTATANTHAGALYTVTAAVGAISGTFSLTNTVGAVSSVTAAPASQSAVVTTAFAAPVVVTVTDSSGNPIAGQTVTFAAPAQTGPSATFAPVGPYTTDAAGHVTVTATANLHAGAAYTVTASVGVTQGAFSLTNTVGAVSSVTAAPASQSTVVTTAFATPVVVTVTDSSGNPIIGQTVTFAAPAQTGPSATFAPAGPYTTDAAGEVTVTATANLHAGAAYTVTASVGVTQGTFSLTNTVGAVSSVTAAPAAQATIVTTAFAAPVVVTVTDSSGNPIIGQTVTFTPPAQTGPSATFAPAGPYTTDAAGHVTVTATANSHAGAPYTVTAAVGATQGTFILTNTVGAVSSVTAAPPSQSTEVTTDFATDVVVTVTDSSGNPISGQTVTFDAPLQTDPSVTFAPAGPYMTDAAGEVTVTATANSHAGAAYTVTASVGATQGTFSLTNTVGAVSSVTAAPPSQSTVVTTDFATDVVVTVTDSSGNPISGQTVDLAAPLQTGPSATFAPAGPYVTDAAGEVTVTATANTHAGAAYTVTASVGATSGTFALTNTVGAVSTVAVTPASQSTVVTTAFATPIVVTVTDSSGNPISGQTVDLAAPAQTGPSATFAPAGPYVTDAAGQVTVTATANSHAGAAYTATAAVGVTLGTFSLTNTVGAVSSVTAAPPSQSTVVTTTFAAPVVVTVTDSSNNPISGQTVTFAAPVQTGPSATFAPAGPYVTDASGQVTVTATANTHAGPAYTVTAAVGATSGTFSLTNTVGAVSSVTVTPPSQSTVVNTAFAAPVVVTVTDANSNPISGQTVAFAAPAQTGPSATFAPAGPYVTDAAGQVTVTATANTHAGAAYTATAAVGFTLGTFSLTNTVGAVANVTATGGSNQTTTINTAFANPLAVMVTDAFDNPVENAVVVLAGPAPTLASATFAGTFTTDASGEVSLIATANSHAGGPYTVTASVGTPSATFTLTNTHGAATQIATSGGDLQQTMVTTVYAAALMVTVSDVGGNPVPGVSATFTAPSSGASVTLSQLIAVTDAMGHASVVATANTVAGALQVGARLPGAIPPATFSLTNTPAPAASLRVVSGGVQTTQVSTAFSAPLVVIAVDPYGNPVPNVPVTWAGPASGASATPGASGTVTGADGQTTIDVTANDTAGTYPFTAALPGGQQADFILTNSSTPPVTIVAVSGTPQAAVIATAFAAPLVVLVTTDGVTPLAGATVTFVVPSGGPSAVLSSNTAITDPTGRAQITAVAGRIAGDYSVVATVARAASPAAFDLTNEAGAAASIQIGPGSSPQSAQVGTPFTAPLIATVVDIDGNPVPGVPVTFTLPGAAPTATLDTPTPVNTDASGQATVHATAGATTGTYAVVATAPGVPGNATFTLTNLAGPPLLLSVVSGTPQSATVNTAFGQSLSVLVTDGGGTPQAGVSVTFGAPASGATATLSGPTTGVTDGAGHARIDATAGTVAGRYDVVATAAGAAVPVSFVLVNTAGAPATITAVASGTPQTARVTTAYALPLQVMVSDSFGNPVQGASIAYAAPTVEPTATLTSSPPTTDSFGRASVVAIASTQAGHFLVRATVTGASAAAVFDLTNIAGDAAGISVISGAGQTTSATLPFGDPLIVLVVDSQGNPVPNSLVTITLPSSGPGATTPALTVATDAEGHASFSLTANDRLGTFSVSLSAAGAGSPVTIMMSVTSIPTVTVLAVTPVVTTLDVSPTLTATVTAEAGTPSGTVRFLLDGQDVGMAALSSSGVGTLVIAAPALGPHRVAAVYDAQGIFGASMSAELAMDVGLDAGSLTGGGGCSVGGDAGGLLGALLLAFALCMARRRALLLVVALVSLASRSARADGAGIDFYRTAPAGSDWFTLDSLDLRGHLRPALRFVLDYAHHPLVVYNSDGSTRSVAVTSQLWLNLGGSLTLADRLRFSANVPVLAQQSGEESTFNGVRVDPPGSSGIGDVALAVDIRLYGVYGEPFTVAAGVSVALPTGSSEDLLGDGRVAVVPHLSIAGEAGAFQYAGQVGFAFRSGQIADVKFNNEVRFGASAGVRLFDRRLLVGPELYGMVDTGESGGQARKAALEADLGAHYQVARDWRVGVGAGTGVAKSPGVPDLRVLASLEWAPAIPIAPPPAQARVSGDADGDGVLDDQDLCPLLAQGAHPDPDKLGCPATEIDDDLDGDGLVDRVDACPDMPGVPDPDPTKNGCPAQPNVVVLKDNLQLTEKIHFGWDKSNLDDASFPVLDEVIRALKENPGFRVQIDGHADSTGPNEHNQSLSERRAEAVLQYIAAHGISRDRLDSKGFSSSMPVEPNTTEAGRGANRRVQFVVDFIMLHPETTR